METQNRTTRVLPILTGHLPPIPFEESVAARRRGGYNAAMMDVGMNTTGKAFGADNQLSATRSHVLRNLLLGLTGDRRAR